MSTDHLSFIRDELKKAKDLGLPIKEDLYSHLTEVFNRIMLSHPKDAYDRFETISKLVKMNNFKITDPPTDDEVNSRRVVVTNQEALEFIQQARNLMNQVVPGGVARPKMIEIERNNNCVLTNFLDQAEMLEWAGYGFGENTNFMI